MYSKILIFWLKKKVFIIIFLIKRHKRVVLKSLEFILNWQRIPVRQKKKKKFEERKQVESKSAKEVKWRMREGTKNAMRSGVVVVGALAFGYLTLQLYVKPFLEKEQHRLQNNSTNLGQSPPPPGDDDQHFDNASLIPDDGPSTRDS